MSSSPFSRKKIGHIGERFISSPYSLKEKLACETWFYHVYNKIFNNLWFGSDLMIKVAHHVVLVSPIPTHNPAANINSVMTQESFYSLIYITYERPVINNNAFLIN